MASAHIMRAMKTLQTLLRGVNLSALSRATGIHLRTLHRIKSGVTPNPHPRTAAAIRKELDK